CMTKKSILAVSVLLALAAWLVPGSRAEAAQVKFPDTNAGRRAAAYFKAYNTMKDEDMQAYLEANLAPEAIAKRSVQDRIQALQRIRTDAGTVEPQKILDARDDAITLFVKGTTGKWFEWSFRFEKEAPGRLLGASIKMLDGPPDLDEPTTPLGPNEFLKQIEARMGDLVAKDEFSGVVLVAKGGTALFEKAYGLASKEYGVPNRVDTRFNLGSLCKIITHIAVEQLAAKGALALDDELGKFLPDYPNKEAAEKITIRELLDMTSGVGDFFGEKYDATPKNRIRNLADYLPLFASEPLLFEPGTKNQYSNGGYLLLGLIIEKASGQSYYDYVREHIYEPAGMKSTGHLEADVPVENVASGYTLTWDGGDHAGEPRRNNIYTRPARGSSAGGGYSTVDDLLKLVLALKAGTFPAPETAGMFAGSGYYAGGAPGISAFVGTEPATDCTIIVLSNYDPPTAVKTGNALAHLAKRLQ
ncbi:MAG: serine hydrolase domain-containing protein, partial [Candidatus Krumholzibacteriaceae bacterium]